MIQTFKDFFQSEGITEYNEVSADNLRIIQPHLMPENIKSAIIWLIPYYTGSHPDRNISLYAVSKDYHLYSKALGGRLCELAKATFPKEEFYCFCDSSPINEVIAATVAGLGVLGQNRLLINKTYGTYVFIGCMLSTMEPCEPQNQPLKNCNMCGLCVKNCNFLAGTQDACMSELNQRKILSEAELKSVRAEKIRWGCDKCQEICPMNKDVSLTPIDFFYQDNIDYVTSEMIENMSKDEFRKRAFSWRGKKTILRNLTD